jgi:hypothetical protein
MVTGPGAPNGPDRLEITALQVWPKGVETLARWGIALPTTVTMSDDKTRFVIFESAGQGLCLGSARREDIGLMWHGHNGYIPCAGSATHSRRRPAVMFDNDPEDVPLAPYPSEIVGHFVGYEAMRVWRRHGERMHNRFVQRIGLS